jgi:hypothetical protein
LLDADRSELQLVREEEVPGTPGRWGVPGGITFEAARGRADAVDASGSLGMRSMIDDEVEGR